VLRLLDAAAQEIDGMAAGPPPLAWFTGFRDNSREYRLHAWVADYDRTLALQSTLRVAIAGKLHEAGVNSA